MVAEITSWQQFSENVVDIFQEIGNTACTIQKIGTGKNQWRWWTRLERVCLRRSRSRLIRTRLINARTICIERLRYQRAGNFTFVINYRFRPTATYRHFASIDFSSNTIAGTQFYIQLIHIIHVTNNRTYQLERSDTPEQELLSSRRETLFSDKILIPFGFRELKGSCLEFRQLRFVRFEFDARIYEFLGLRSVIRRSFSSRIEIRSRDIGIAVNIW